MLGLMYVGAAMLYLLLMWKVVRWAWVRGREGGGSFVRGIVFSVIGFLFVFLPIFWNWIPTAVVHRSLCNQDAGFKLSLSAKQWVDANASTLSALHGIDINKSTKTRVLPNGFARSEFFGGILARESLDQKFRRYAMDIWRQESRIVDARTGTPLVSRVDYSIGSRDDARIWMTKRSCFSRSTKLLEREESYIEDLVNGMK